MVRQCWCHLLSFQPNFYARTKHIEVCYYYIREKSITQRANCLFHLHHRSIGWYLHERVNLCSIFFTQKQAYGSRTPHNSWLVGSNSWKDNTRVDSFKVLFFFMSPISYSYTYYYLILTLHDYRFFCIYKCIYNLRNRVPSEYLFMKDFSFHLPSLSLSLFLTSPRHLPWNGSCIVMYQSACFCLLKL